MRRCTYVWLESPEQENASEPHKRVHIAVSGSRVSTTRIWLRMSAFMESPRTPRYAADGERERTEKPRRVSDSQAADAGSLE